MKGRPSSQEINIVNIWSEERNVSAARLIIVHPCPAFPSQPWGSSHCRGLAAAVSEGQMVARAEGTWPSRAVSGPRDCGHQGVGKWGVCVFKRARRKTDDA